MNSIDQTRADLPVNLRAANGEWRMLNGEEGSGSVAVGVPLVVEGGVSPPGIHSSTYPVISDSWKTRPPMARAVGAHSLFMTDIDGTLIAEGNTRDQPGLEEFKDWVTHREGRFAWGVATGRRLELVRRVFDEHELPVPDFVVASVGVEIHLDLSGTRVDADWTRHINHRWDANAVRAIALSLPGLTPQKTASQHAFKVSFQIDGSTFRRADLETALGDLLPDTNVIITRNTHLDLLPARASKWLAIRHLCARWGFPLENLIVAGDSGNDLDMVGNAPRAIIVGNHSDELDTLRGRPGAYFSVGHAALGIGEGIRHFGFPGYALPGGPV